mmetsp:Transcript_3094/g.4121  ORF Transcript_3094/g.4121 Transcript_3094/m.4121 type:complete len:96 (+) Transcript_3094:162-449(+)
MASESSDGLNSRYHFKTITNLYHSHPASAPHTKHYDHYPLLHQHTKYNPSHHHHPGSLTLVALLQFFLLLLAPSSCRHPPNAGIFWGFDPGREIK